MSGTFPLYQLPSKQRAAEKAAAAAASGNTTTTTTTVNSPKPAIAPVPIAMKSSGNTTTTTTTANSPKPAIAPVPIATKSVAGSVHFADTPSFIASKPMTRTNLIASSSSVNRPNIPSPVADDQATLEETASVQSGSDVAEPISPRRETDSPPTLDDLSDEEGGSTHIPMIGELQAQSFSQSNDEYDPRAVDFERGYSLRQMIDEDGNPIDQSDQPVNDDDHGYNHHSHSHTHDSASNQAARLSGRLESLQIGVASTDENDLDNEYDHGDYRRHSHRMPSAELTPTPRNKVSYRNQLNNIENVILFFRYFNRYDKPKLLKAFRRIRRLHDETKIFTVNVEQYGLTRMLLELLQEYTIGGFLEGDKEGDREHHSDKSLVGSSEDLHNHHNFSEKSNSGTTSSNSSTDHILPPTPPDTKVLENKSGSKKFSKHAGNEDIVIELLLICNELVILPTTNDLDARGRDNLGINPRDIYHVLNVFSFLGNDGLPIIYRLMKHYVGIEKTNAEKRILSLFLRLLSALGSTHECQSMFEGMEGCQFLIGQIFHQHQHDAMVIAEACQCIANMSFDETNRQHFLTLDTYTRVEETLYLHKKECRVVECACNAMASLAMIPILGDLTISSAGASISTEAYPTSPRKSHRRVPSGDGNSSGTDDSMPPSIALPQHHYHIPRPVATEKTCELLVEVLEGHKQDDKPVVAICRAMEKLANQVDLIAFLGRAGCCELIVEVCTTHIECPEVLEYAGAVIQKLALVPEHRRGFSKQQHGQRKSGCEILAKVLRSYRRNRYVIAPTCRAIRHLALDRDNQLSFGDLSVCEVLADLLAIHESHQECVEAILGAIWSMSTHDEFQIRFARREGFCEMLVEVVKVHRKELKVAEQGCGVLKNLALQQELRLKLGLLRCCELLAEILRYYGHCPLPPSGNNYQQGGSGSGNGNGNGNGSQNGSASGAPSSTNARTINASGQLTRSALAKLSYSNLSTVSTSNTPLSSSGNNTSEKGSQSGASTSHPYHPYHHRANSNGDREYNPRERERNDSSVPSTPRGEKEMEPSTPLSAANVAANASTTEGNTSRRHSFNSQTSDTNSLTPSQPGTQPYKPLTQSEMDVVEQCLWAIWNIAANADNEKKLGRLHVCYFISFVLRNNKETAQLVEPACGAVKNLSVNKDNIVKFSALNVCELLVELLARYSSAPGRTSINLGAGGARASLNLSTPTSTPSTAHGHDANRFSVSRLGEGAGRVVSWKHHQLDISKQICSAIRNLAMFSEENCRRFGRAGCCEILIYFAKMMIITINTGGAVVHNNRGSARFSVGSQQSSGTDRGESGISPHHDMLIKICLTMSHLARSPDNQSKFGHGGACNLMVEMVVAFREKPSVLEQAFQTMKAFSAVPENQMLLGEADACKMVVDISRIHIGNVSITECAAGCIKNLSDMAVNKDRLGQDGACELLIEILKLHRSRAHIVGEAISSLFNLSFNDKNRLILSKTKIVDLAKSLKELHIKDPEIVKCCDALIDKFKPKKFLGIIPLK